MKWWQVAVPALVAGAIAVFASKRPNSVDDVPGSFPAPMYMGKRGDPKLEELLAEMDAYFASKGIDTSTVTAAELTKLHYRGDTRDLPADEERWLQKWMGHHAIPPRDLWPYMAYMLYHVWQPARQEYGRPIKIIHAYRPPIYNKAVCGARGSHHQWGSAFDATADDMDTLAMILAEVYVTRADELNMGLRIYGAPHASRFHADAGTRTRPHAGASTKYWLEQIGVMA